MITNNFPPFNDLGQRQTIGKLQNDIQALDLLQNQYSWIPYDWWTVAGAYQASSLRLSYAPRTQEHRLSSFLQLNSSSNSSTGSEEKTEVKVPILESPPIYVEEKKDL
jgi:hypothetical protein